MYRTLNLNALRNFQPQAWEVLAPILASDFECAPDEISFLSLNFPRFSSDSGVGLPPDPTALLVYGMGDGKWLRTVLQQLAPSTPVLVLDAQPELAWCFLEQADLSDLLADPRLTWLVAEAGPLITTYQAYRQQLQDRYGLSFLKNPEIGPIAERFNSPFLQFLQQELSHQPPAVENLEPSLKQLYTNLEPAMQMAYGTYPLTCHSGCADCCHGMGFQLCVNPLEWQAIHQALLALTPEIRQQIYQQSVTYLAQHTPQIKEWLYFFDHQPERYLEPDFHAELQSMNQPFKQQPCLFLGNDQRCQIYSGRPLACRMFGNSHVQQKHPFTCNKDWQQMEQILLQEGPQHKLVDSSHYRQILWKLHTDLPHKQVLNLWIFTHLDFENKDFQPEARLDYQQFQSLVRHPELLQKKFAALQAHVT